MYFLVFYLTFFSQHPMARCQDTIDINAAIQIGLSNSYEIRKYRNELLQSQYALDAIVKSYKSNASIYGYIPTYTNQYKQILNPETGKINIVRFNNIINTTSLQISQPIALTDGTISINNSFYTIHQVGESNYQNDLTLKLSQPLFKTSTRKIELKQAELQLERTKINYEKLKIEFIYSIKSNYLNLLKTKREYEIALESESRSKETYDRGLSKYKVGLLTEIELLQLEVDISNDKYSRLYKETDYKNELEDFKLLLNIESDKQIEISDDILLDTVMLDERFYEIDVQGSAQFLMDELDIKSLELNIKKTDASREFSMDLNFEFGFTQNKTMLKDFFVDPEMAQIVNVGIVVPLWDNGQNKAEVMAATEKLNEAKLTANYNELLVKRELDRIALLIGASKEVLMNSKKTIGQAKRSYEYKLMQFENASISHDELTLARERLNTAMLNNLDAKIEYIQAVELANKYVGLIFK